LTYEEKYQAVSDALQDRRIQKVAAATGLSRGTLYSVLNKVGTKPHLPTLNTLAQYLGIKEQL
jgi:DNA-binding phage protein